MNTKHYRSLGLVVMLVSSVLIQDLQAKKSSIKTVKPAKIKKQAKTYRKKGIYAGLGKVSTKTGKIKVKSTSGHWKGSPKNGFKFVHSYSRSK